MTKTPKLKSEPVPASKRITKSLLARYSEIVETKRELDARSRAFDKELASLKSVIMDYANEHGNDCETCGYHVHVVEAGRFPSWKDAFVERLGEAAAEEVTEKTAPRLALKVEAL